MDVLDELLSPAGQELLERLAGEELTPERSIALGTALRASYPASLVAAALSLTELRMLARSKFTRADRMWFTREGLEQATPEVVARHTSGRYEGMAGIADLCTGIGGDLIMLAQRGPVLAVDVNRSHLRMAGLNAEVYGRGDAVTLLQGDVREVDLAAVGAVFVDPSRRDGGRRLPAGRSDPPLDWCLALAGRVPAVGVKAAPGLPLDLVPAAWEVEFISQGRSLKEALLWSPAMATTARRATLLPEGHTLVPAAGPPVAVAAPGAHVVDPDPAVTRAGLVEELARSLGLWKLDEQIAFLAGDEPVRTPFGRTLRVQASMPWSLKRLRAALRAMGVGSVDLRKRGSAVDVDQLRRQLDLSGDRRVTVLLTRVLGQPWTLICDEPDEPAPTAPPGSPGASARR